MLLLATCNRVEVYADVARFHPRCEEITTVLARHAGLAVADLAEHLYVHFAEAAAEHMFTVASGLDSMVVGESQILGQLRSAYALGTELGTAGTVLHDLAQTALRVGKRVHTDTGIDRAGASIVSVALDIAEQRSGSLAGRRALLVGAGSMGALAGATLRRRGLSDFVVANRSPERAARLAAHARRPSGVADRARRRARRRRLGGVRDRVHRTGRGSRHDRCAWLAPAGRPRPRLAARRRPQRGRPPGVTYVDLEALRTGGATVSDAEVQAATAIVAEELRDYLAEQQRLAVAPTVTALRARANQVIDGELTRLDGRLPQLSPTERREVADAVRRAVEKVLHAPTVRVKELASTPGGDQYAAALRELFDLDPAAAESVAAVKQPGAAQ